MFNINENELLIPQITMNELSFNSFKYIYKQLVT